MSDEPTRTADLAKIDAAIRSLENLPPNPDLESTLKVLLKQRRLLLESPTIQTGDIHAKNGGIIKVAGHDVVTNESHFHAPDPRQIEAEKTAAARKRYLEKLSRYCQALPLAALGGEENADDEITLDRVYIELDTTTRNELKAEDENGIVKNRSESEADALPVSALEAARREHRLVLLGDPGSGKSTFVRKLLAWLCKAQLEGSPLPSALQAALIPLLINLRDLALRLKGIKMDGLPADDISMHLLQAVREQIASDLEKLDALSFQQGVLDAFSSGICLLVLDGLDETPHSLQRWVQASVRAISESCQTVQIIVTCRIRSYTGEAVLPYFTPYTLAPFDRLKIEHFARAWYRAQNELGRVDAVTMAYKSADLTKSALGADLSELSQNPMLLTSMAIIHQKEIGLPRRQVLLYNMMVDVLLRRWQERRAGSQGLSPSLADFIKNDQRLRSAMERLGYEAHTAGTSEQKAAELARGTALTLLDHPEYLGSLELANEFLDYIDAKAGLLVGRGGERGRPAVYSFPHRTFQEYLAGCYLVNHRYFSRMIAAKASEGDAWRPALVLGAEDLLYNRRGINVLLDLAYHLAPVRCKDEETERLIAWAGELANLATADAIRRDPAPRGGSDFIDHISHGLVKAVHGKLSAPERARAGDTLAILGDPRFDSSSWFLPKDKSVGFIHIPAGAFYMGSEDNEDEQPEHKLSLPDYYMARFPVTIAQFRAFVEENSFQLCNPDCLSSPITRPVVLINWHEARSYCLWLNEKLQEAASQLITKSTSELTNLMWQGLLERKLAVQLPSEAEWEKAARGSKEPRTYPWNGELGPDKANFIQSGIRISSAVGCFPNGTSPYGCQDMSGNVWEWTRSLWGEDSQTPEYKYPYINKLKERENLFESDAIRRVIRGGSFDDNPGFVRCSRRDGSHPDQFFSNIGFRVCISPSP